MDNLYKIYALNNKWTKHLEVIGCVKLHNRPDSLSEQSKIRLNNEWGMQRIWAKLTLHGFIEVKVVGETSFHGF